MTRVSRVLMTGPVAPFADAYRAELLERAIRRCRRSMSFGRWRGSAGGSKVVG